MVGPSVGTIVGTAVGLKVGLVVGPVVRIKVGFALGSDVGVVVAPGVLAGLLLAPGPLPKLLELFEDTSGMAVGPTAARVVEPAIDERGPSIAAPVGVAPRPACEATMVAATTTSASENITLGDRRSIPRILTPAAPRVDGEVVRVTSASDLTINIGARASSAGRGEGCLR